MQECNIALLSRKAAPPVRVNAEFLIKNSSALAAAAKEQATKKPALCGAG
jgi:hypothetical protein